MGYLIFYIILLSLLLKGNINESETTHIEYTIVIYLRVCCILQAGEIYYGQLL